MAENWKSVVASEVAPGDRVRSRGVEITVSRIEPAFFGNPAMVAFIEDTPERWFKMPMMLEAEVEVA